MSLIVTHGFINNCRRLGTCTKNLPTFLNIRPTYGKPKIMASPTFEPIKVKETTNYARLCRLLVVTGTEALRKVFDRILPAESLPLFLASQPVRETLRSLRQGKRQLLHSTQWEKLNPKKGSPVSLANFDLTLLTVLLRIMACELSPSSADVDRRDPPVVSESLQADIVRLKYYRNMVYSHCNHASLSEETFSSYWETIRKVMIRLGGHTFGAIIDKMKYERMDADIGGHYQELLKQLVKHEEMIEERLKRIKGTCRRLHVFEISVHFEWSCES